jgi:hypothetical protein
MIIARVGKKASNVLNKWSFIGSITADAYTVKKNDITGNKNGSFSFCLAELCSPREKSIAHGA